MVQKNPYPPSHHHSTLSIAPSTASKHLSTFLTATQTHPHLHPDSLLSSAGISFSTTSGPRGGLAIHHLRRIEAGLRGENLVVESQEDLDALFGAEGDDGDARGKGEGDDERLDALIAETERKGGRRERKKRKREEIEEWAETSSQAAPGADEHSPLQREIESFATTPMHQPFWQQEGEWQQEGDQWQDQEDYGLAQRPLEGEVGEREGAPVVRQNGAVPRVEEHDEEGRVREGMTKPKEDKEARKAAKKARKEKEKRKVIKEREKRRDEA